MFEQKLTKKKMRKSDRARSQFDSAFLASMITTNVDSLPHFTQINEIFNQSGWMRYIARQQTDRVFCFCLTHFNPELRIFAITKLLSFIFCVIFSLLLLSRCLFNEFDMK